MLFRSIWDTNFPSDQGFEMSFHYAVGVQRAGERISAEGLALRTAASLTAPLAGVLAPGAPGPRQSVAEARLLEVSDDRVQVVDVTALERADEVLVRLQSFAKIALRVRLAAHRPVAAAHRTNYLGSGDDPLIVSDGATQIDIPRLGTAAVRMRLAGSTTGR